MSSRGVPVRLRTFHVRSNRNWGIWPALWELHCLSRGPRRQQIPSAEDVIGSGKGTGWNLVVTGCYEVPRGQNLHV